MIASKLTRLQMLQLHSRILSGEDLSSGFDFNATLIAPQWQLPVYILPPSMAAVGSGPVNFGGT